MAAVRVALRGVLKVFAVLLLMCAPVFGLADESFGQQGAQLQTQFDSDLCRSFDFSRVQYHEALLAQRHADNRFARFQGKTIASIDYVRVDVFDEDDPRENNRLYQFVNSLNMRTRISAIVPQVLFRVGEVLDPAAVAETERNLRAQGYLADAYVMPVAACGDAVHLVVVTQDAWTTQPVISASREGGRNESRYGLVEGNFLGSGSEISVVVKNSDDRNSVSYGLRKDYLFDLPLRVKFGYSDNSDGFSHAFNVAKPFYTDATRWGFDVSIDESNAVQTVERNEIEIARYQLDSVARSAHVAWQFDLSHASVWRLYSGVSEVSLQYSEFRGLSSLAPAYETDLLYPWFALEKKSTQYIVLKNINYIETVEDIRVGSSWNVALGYSPERDANVSAVISSGEYQQLFAKKDHVYEIRVDYNLVHYDVSERSHYDAQVKLNSWWLHGERNRIFASVQGRVAKPEAIHDAVSLGGAEGVRGYPAFYVLGNKALTSTVEYRYHSRMHLLNVLRIGVAAYADVGVLENTHFELDNGGYDRDVLANVGLGLRLTSSKTHVDNIVHIDLAKPVGYQIGAGDYQLLLRAEKRF